MQDREYEDELIANMERSYRKAEAYVGMYDIDEEDEEARLDRQEDIFHCEVCTVREVLDQVLPAYFEYVNWLKSQIPGYEYEN